MPNSYICQQCGTSLYPGEQHRCRPTDWRFKGVDLVQAILAEALNEDEREGSRFDEDGFSNYFIEETDHEAVEEAWHLYEQMGH